MTDSTFLDSKITVDGDYSHKIKGYFLLERKAMTNLNSILKSKDIILPTNVQASQSYSFSSNYIQMWVGP